MGHPHHFLSRLDRVSREQVELALSLYRDDALLRFLLSDVGLPEGAERAAISLDDPREGPFLVVTREGRFVTCLAKGMRAGALPVVARAQLDGRMARVAAFRQKSEERDRLAAEGRIGTLMTRILRAGDELSCEEFSDLAALQPIAAPHFLTLQMEISGDIEEARRNVIQLFKRTLKPRPANHDMLRSYWNMFWGSGHLLVLAAMTGPEWFEITPHVDPLAYTSMTSKAVDHAILKMALFGLWAAARLGKPLLAGYKQLYEECTTYIHLIETAAALAALGLRHSKLRAEVRKTLSSAPPFFARIDQPKAIATLLAFARMALDVPERCLEYQRSVGAAGLVEMTSRLPEGTPGRYARPEDVPEDLALRFAIDDRSEFLTSGEKVRDLFAFLPWVARASAEELYLPAVVIRAQSEPWRPEHTLDLVRGFIDFDKAYHDYRREQQGPARKGPCPCGSGKKYKHCCEGKVPAPA
jgi:hypothetical protein